jgi:prepilin-type N-terminal cleavage/methylation domain-containing protein
MERPEWPRCKRGFSLIELLVVVSVIAILIGLLLPTLTKAKERAQLATCTSNLRQISLALKMYVQDAGKFPSLFVVDEDKRRKQNIATIGGASPIPSHSPYWLSAAKRPLYRYLPPSRVFECPADAGTSHKEPGAPDNIMQKPTSFGTVGCSYFFNNGPLSYIVSPEQGGFRKGRAGFLAGNLESWIPSPTKYILLYEPPAGMKNVAGFSQWHRNRGKTDFSYDQVKTAPKLFISPIAFADGHVAVHNFSDAIQADPRYPYEETKDWIWYKPARP